MATKIVLLGAGVCKRTFGFTLACDTLNIESQSESSS